MAASSETEQRAVEAVARHVSAPWEIGEQPPTAFITVDGRRIALETVIVPAQETGKTPAARARFRDDRVARRFLSDLETAVAALTPDGTTVILTLGAPIKLPNQTLAAVTETLGNRLASGIGDVEERLDIHGNRVRFCILRDGSAWTSKAIGFVFTGDPSPRDLANAIRALHAEIAARAETCTPERLSGEWWLVLAGGPWIADAKTYSRALSHFVVPDRFEKIFMVDGRRVEALR